MDSAFNQANPSTIATPPTVAASTTPPTTESAATGTGQANGGTPAPTAGFDGVLTALQDELDKFDVDLKSGQDTVKTATKGKSQAQAEFNQLKKTAVAFSGMKIEANAAIQDAETAKNAAKGLIETLGDDDVQRLANDIAAINQVYAAEQDALKTAEENLLTHQQTTKDLELDVAVNKEILDKISDALSQLPVSIRDLITPLKALTKEIAAASDAGQAMKAFALRSEMDATIQKLGEKLADSTASELVSAYGEAQQNLTDALTKQSENTDKLAEAEATLTSARADVERAKTTRREELAKLYVVPNYKAPAAGSA